MHPVATIAACALALAGPAVAWLTTGIRRDSAAIRASLLREKPPGTPLAEVERWLAKNKRLRYDKWDTGFMKHVPPKPEIVGVKTIRADLGQYSSPLPTSVEAFWSFNERGELIDVRVRKSVDGV